MSENNRVRRLILPRSLIEKYACRALYRLKDFKQQHGREADEQTPFRDWIACTNTPSDLVWACRRLGVAGKHITETISLKALYRMLPVYERLYEYDSEPREYLDLIAQHIQTGVEIPPYKLHQIQSSLHKKHSYGSGHVEQGSAGALLALSMTMDIPPIEPTSAEAGLGGDFHIPLQKASLVLFDPQTFFRKEEGQQRTDLVDALDAYETGSDNTV